MEVDVSISSELWMAAHWWLFVVRGVLAALVGVAAMLFPAITIGALILLFGAFVFVEGVATLVATLRRRGPDQFWHLLDAFAGILVGLFAAIWPGLTALGLLVCVAAWMIFTGVVRSVIALGMRGSVAHPWLLGLAGIAGVVMGIILVVAPAAGALALIWLTGANLLLIGLLFVALGIRLRVGPRPLPAFAG